MSPTEKKAPLEKDEAEKIGLLFVHGIGGPARFEHLKDQALEFAALMKSEDSTARISVVDRTADWNIPAGAPVSTSPAPVTITYIRPQKIGDDDAPAKHIQFECHEVWWGDLGARSDLFDSLNFWFWALGQWCAPIYQRMDASRTNIPDACAHSSTAPDEKRSTDLTAMPESVVGKVGQEMLARTRLLMASMAALYVLVSWSLAKRLFAKLLGKTPSPSLIVQYVGDVRNYEMRATPNTSRLSDPGFPLRVGIRRRMVTEMVAMATRKLDGWYVVAHSLGSVLAYNGLTEIGHTLPNYLPEAQWETLPPNLKHDPGCALRKPADIGLMMPARPGWLAYKDVINRPLLFNSLRGFLTYGSPLEKFAAIWPRIVATASDRRDVKNVFSPQCTWLNLEALQDPVAGRLQGYDTSNAPSNLSGLIPKLITRTTPFGLDFMMAHIRYFINAERFRKGIGSKQKMAVMSWLARSRAEFKARKLPDIKSARRCSIAAVVGYILAIIILFILNAAVITAGGGLTLVLLKAETSISFSAFLAGLAGTLRLWLALSLWIFLVIGLLRWLREVSLNIKLASYDLEHAQEEAKQGLKRLIQILRAQRNGAVFMALLSFIFGLLLCPSFHLTSILLFNTDRVWCAATALGVALIGAAMAAQAGVNRYFHKHFQKTEGEHA